MKFVQLAGTENWLEFREDRMRIYNHKGGGTPIDENSKEWGDAKIIECDDWHDLYCKTGFNPYQIYDFQTEMWIDPEGRCYEGCAHEVVAEALCEIVYGFDEDLYGSGDNLIKAGWIKVSATLMHRYYCEDGMYIHVTQDQLSVLEKWCHKYDLSLEEMIHPYE